MLNHSIELTQHLPVHAVCWKREEGENKVKRKGGTVGRQAGREGMIIYMSVW